jgi:endonuclease/exonuclease/phosphatase family metal-dependent hydrolase
MMKNLITVFFFTQVLTSLTANASLRFSSYNIRNFDYDERSNTPTNKKHLVQIIDQIQADLIAVQEINDADEFERMIDNNYNGKLKAVLSLCGGAHGQKLGFIYNTNKLKLVKFEEDSRVSNPNSPAQSNCNNGSRPLAIGVFKMIDRNEKVVAISLHLKSGGRQSNIDKRFKQHKLINDVVNEYRAKGIKHVVIMGDFNSTQYIIEGDTKNRFKQSVSQMGLTNTTKNISCSAYWWGGAQDSKQYPSILDHILISPSLIGKKSVKVESYGHCKKLNCKVTLESQMGVSFDEVSDHCPLVTEIN